MSKTPTPPFRTCPNCRVVWPDRELFLADVEVVVTGYQVHFEDLALGLFLFNHERCGTTFGLHAGAFADLYKGPIYDESKRETEECSEFCLKCEEFRLCPTACECAYVREVLKVVKDWPKRPAPPPQPEPQTYW